MKLVKVKLPFTAPCDGFFHIDAGQPINPDTDFTFSFTSGANPEPIRVAGHKQNKRDRLDWIWNKERCKWLARDFWGFGIWVSVGEERTGRGRLEPMIRESLKTKRNLWLNDRDEYMRRYQDDCLAELNRFKSGNDFQVPMGYCLVCGSSDRDELRRLCLTCGINDADAKAKTDRLREAWDAMGGNGYAVLPADVKIEWIPPTNPHIEPCVILDSPTRLRLPRILYRALRWCNPWFILWGRRRALAGTYRWDDPKLWSVTR